MEQAAPSPGFAGVRGQRGREKPRSSRSKGRRELGYQGRGRMVVTGLVCGGGGPDCPPPPPPHHQAQPLLTSRLSTARQGERAAAGHDGPSAHAALGAQALQSASE